MATVLELLIKGNASGALEALGSVGKGAGDVDTKLGKFNSTMRKAAVPAAAVAGGLVAVGKASFDSASALEQSAGAVESVFGTYATQVQQHADQAAQNVGLAKSQYNDLSSVLGAQLQNMGISQDQLAGQTDNLIGLGSDLAATFGGSTSDAVEALSSLMRGERDPIEKYGVSIKAADVEAKKAAMGLAGLTGEADAAATTQATLALVTEQTAGAHGAFAREADTAAGQQQRATAEWENAKAALGQGLLPVVSSAAQILAQFGQWVQQNAGLVGTLAVVIGTLAAGVLAYNAVQAALPAIQAVATAAQWAWNAAMSANPIGLIILAIAALIAIIVLVVQNWDTVKAVAIAVWDATLAAVQGFLDWVAGAWQIFVDANIAAWNAIKDAAAKVWQAITDTIQAFFDWVGGIVQAIIDFHVRAFNAIKDGAATAWRAVTDTVQTFFSWVGGIAQKVADFHVRAFNAIKDGAATAWRAVTDSVQKFFTWVAGAVRAVPDAFKRGFDSALGWVTGSVDRMWSALSGFIDSVGQIPRRIQSALSNVRLPSWVSKLSGFVGFSTSAPAFYASTLAASTWRPSTGIAGPSATGGGVTIQVNVTGDVLDADALVDKLRDGLNRSARARGVVGLAGVVIA